jgi:transglutaminase-like putative cysteine protease
MRIHFVHATHYRYSKPVLLMPQILRLRPREDGFQRLLSYQCTIQPLGHHQAPLIDAEGNVVLRAWFDKQASRLDIMVEGLVETLRTNPFDFVLEPEASSLPWKGLALRHGVLLPSLFLAPGPPKKNVSQLAADLFQQSQGQTIAYLSLANQHISGFRRLNRAQGQPWPAEETLEKAQGSCRDLVVLFIELCRLQGIPARFVSGYFLEHPDQREHDLHAWAEVYLPGAGWRGFDPSCGLACSNAHVPLAAAARPADCAPVEGVFSGPASSEFKSSLELNGQA